MLESKFSILDVIGKNVLRSTPQDRFSTASVSSGSVGIFGGIGTFCG
jgi:hypothetical protein